MAGFAHSDICGSTLALELHEHALSRILADSPEKAGFPGYNFRKSTSFACDIEVQECLAATLNRLEFWIGQRWGPFMKDARHGDLELKLAKVLNLPRPGSESNEEEVSTWKRAWEEFLSDNDFIESIQLSLEMQFGAGNKYRDARETALHNTLVKFYTNGAWNYDPAKAHGGLVAYVGKIAYHEMLDLLGKPSVEVQSFADESIGVVDHKSASAMREIVFQDWFAWLENQLESDEKDILDLRVRDEMTFQEISERVEKPLSTVHDIWKRLCKRAAKFE